MDLKEWVKAAPGYLWLVARGQGGAFDLGENELWLLAEVKRLLVKNETVYITTVIVATTK
jgi:hypothetical protein